MGEVDVITGQVQSIVFDGTRPLITSLLVPRKCAFPWLVDLTDIAGSVIDMSGTALSGTTTIRWGAALGIARDYGDGGPMVLTVTTTATPGGSVISWPNGGSDGQILVYLSPTDTEALPAPETDGANGYSVFSFVVTDLGGITYCIARGILYPQEHIPGGPS